MSDYIGCVVCVGCVLVCGGGGWRLVEGGDDQVLVGVVLLDQCTA